MTRHPSEIGHRTLRRHFTRSLETSAALDSSGSTTTTTAPSRTSAPKQASSESSESQRECLAGLGGLEPPTLSLGNLFLGLWRDITCFYVLLEQCFEHEMSMALYGVALDLSSELSSNHVRWRTTSPRHRLPRNGAAARMGLPAQPRGGGSEEPGTTGLKVHFELNGDSPVQHPPSPILARRQGARGA